MATLKERLWNGESGWDAVICCEAVSYRTIVPFWVISARIAVICLLGKQFGWVIPIPRSTTGRVQWAVYLAAGVERVAMTASNIRAVAILAILPVLAVSGCSEDDPVSGDYVAPRPIEDLAVTETDQTSVTLTWSASGDDVLEGTASSYDLRYSETAITAATWNASMPVSGEPTPQAPGETEVFTVTGLEPNTPYNFALRVIDDAENSSALSNIVSATTVPQSGNDSNWWDGFKYDGFNLPVNALAVYDNRLVAGGAFTKAGDRTIYRIAEWNGVNWGQLGEGMSGDVRALAVHDGNLYAGGSFGTFGDEITSYIGMWDGNEWSSLGRGMNSVVLALTSWQGYLIAGGLFTEAGGEEAHYIARWDGFTWSPIAGLDGPVYSLTVHNGDLIAGGRFTRAGENDVRQVARWDGMEWRSLNGGLFVSPPPASASALHVYEGRLIAGGYFETAGDAPAHMIASWNGTNWDTFGSGMDDMVLALAGYGGLVAGGTFNTAGARPAGQLARWDGTIWRSFASGFRGGLLVVNALVVFDGSLYVGGSFETAGGKESKNIARWTD